MRGLSWGLRNESIECNLRSLSRRSRRQLCSTAFANIAMYRSTGRVKVVVTGSSGVGKTSTIRRLRNESFLDLYEETSGTELAIAIVEKILTIYLKSLFIKATIYS